MESDQAEYVRSVGKVILFVWCEQFAIKLLNIFFSCPPPDDEQKKLKVTMVSWDYSDKWIITAVNDFTVSLFFIFVS